MTFLLAGVCFSLGVLAIGFQLGDWQSPEVTFHPQMDNTTCLQYRWVQLSDIKLESREYTDSMLSCARHFRSAFDKIIKLS